jgi:hypothetical protein
MKVINILKYADFIKEGNEVSHMRGKLGIIEKQLKKLIPEEGNIETEDEISLGQAKAQGQGQDKEDELTLKDFNVRPVLSEMSKGHSSSIESLTFRFEDDNSDYTFFISTDITDATKSESDEDIEKFKIMFKKYNKATTEMAGPPIEKNIEIKTDKEYKLEISVVEKNNEQPVEPEKTKGGTLGLEEFLVSLKLEIDKKYGDEQDELVIETE